MAISKIILNGVTQMDVTQDTVAAANLLLNETATGADGQPVTGAYVPPAPTLQTKSVSYTPTESAQSATVTADQGYDGLDEVNVSVGAISSSYVGSAIDRRDSTDLSASGATVTAPAGYYANAATKTLDEQAAQTIHPSTSDQTIASGKYLTGTQTIKAVTTTNLTAANIVSGVTVEIGDADDSDCVASVTGTASGGGGYSETDINALINANLGTGEYTFNTSGRLGSAFRNAQGAYTLHLPNITSIYSQYAFDASQIAVIDAPLLDSASNYAFNGCTNLTSVYFPAGISGARTFNNCTGLVTAVLKTMGTLNTNANAFYGCSSLKTVDIIGTTNINNAWPNNNGNFDTLILRATSVQTLSNTSAFAGSKFKQGGAGGTIYIPKSLYDHLGDGTSSDYKAASNWSTVDGWGTITWAKIEGTIYETQYADGTTIPTT